MDYRLRLTGTDPANGTTTLAVIPHMANAPPREPVDTDLRITFTDQELADLFFVFTCFGHEPVTDVDTARFYGIDAKNVEAMLCQDIDRGRAQREAVDRLVEAIADEGGHAIDTEDYEILEAVMSRHFSGMLADNAWFEGLCRRIEARAGGRLKAVLVTDPPRAVDTSRGLTVCVAVLKDDRADYYVFSPYLGSALEAYPGLSAPTL